MSGRFGKVFLLALAGLLLSGCGGKMQFAMPWDKGPTSANDIPIREPLEIPPDLDVLPEPQVENANEDGNKEGESAKSILFGTPKPEEDKPLGRHDQEVLPDWMRAGGNSPQQ